MTRFRCCRISSGSDCGCAAGSERAATAAGPAGRRSAIASPLLVGKSLEPRHSTIIGAARRRLSTGDDHDNSQSSAPSLTTGIHPKHGSLRCTAEATSSISASIEDHIIML